jgi:hypothetical protein
LGYTCVIEYGLIEFLSFILKDNEENENKNKTKKDINYTIGSFGFALHTSRPFAKPLSVSFCQRAEEL